MNKKRILGGLWLTIAFSGFLYMSWTEVLDIKRVLIILIVAEVLSKAIRVIDYLLYRNSCMELFLKKLKRDKYSRWAAIGRQIGYLFLIFLGLLGMPRVALVGMALISVIMMTTTFAIFITIGSDDDDYHSREISDVCL